MFEVEIKFSVVDPDLLERRLTEFGVEFAPEIEEQDRFYQHPVRDFTRSDEALRLRRTRLPDGTEQTFLTYKGPKIDTETKTRREIEIPLSEPALLNDILLALSFEPKGHVRKFRRPGRLLFENRQFNVLLDRLPDLLEKGLPGTFVELETLTDETSLVQARQDLLGLARRLGLSDSIRTSYLGLLEGMNAEQ